MSYTNIPTTGFNERRVSLIINEEEYKDFIDMADEVGLPLKSLIMKTLRTLSKEHKARKKNFEITHNS